VLCPDNHLTSTLLGGCDNFRRFPVRFVLDGCLGFGGGRFGLLENLGVLTLGLNEDLLGLPLSGGHDLLCYLHGLGVDTLVVLFWASGGVPVSVLDG